jgi:molybdenum cofactor cytidylyltransferase
MKQSEFVSVPAIILAAGASRRLGQPKQLVLDHGETLLGRAIRIAREAGAAPIVVVLGAEVASIRAAMGPRGDAVLVENSGWEEGIGSSIRAGVHAAEVNAPNSTGALLMSCDQPRLTSEHLRTLMMRFHNQFEAGIVTSVYAATRGVPAVFPRSVFPLLVALKGDHGARSILMKPPCVLAEVGFKGGEIDIDVPDDLNQLG